jgi:heme exporter protein C
MLRSGIRPRPPVRFGFLSVPLTFFSARLFRTIHPVVIGTNQPGAEGAFDMTADMRLVFFFSLITFNHLRRSALAPYTPGSAAG